MTKSVSGLYKYEIENLDLIKHYIFDINDKTSITSSSLQVLTEYNDEIYIGSEGDGIFIYQNDSIGFQNINTDNGLLSNNVKNFLKHINFYLFLTDRGINYFDFEVMSTLTDGNNNNLRNINKKMVLILKRYKIMELTFYNDLIYLFTKNEIQKLIYIIYLRITKVQ